MYPCRTINKLVQYRVIQILVVATMLYINLNFLMTGEILEVQIEDAYSQNSSSIGSAKLFISSLEPEVTTIFIEAKPKLGKQRQYLREVKPGNFPKLLPAEVMILQNLSERIDLFQTVGAKNDVLKALSSIVQAQFLRLQLVDQADCTNQPTINCGHNAVDCGFGCQISHRKTCLAISYSTNLPLIHDDVTAWQYKKKWREAFQQLGSNCRPGPLTHYARWSNTGPILINGGRTMRFPFWNGLIVPKSINELVNKVHLNPFQWWAGQFAEFTIRLTQAQRKSIDQSKRRVGLDIHSPTFGFHVRRTDKKTEEANAWHPITDYFKIMDQFQHAFNLSSNSTIFVASEEHTVLSEAIQAYPNKNIIGFPFNQSLGTPTSRMPFLDDIIRDIIILFESDYIVCGLSSTFCRLVLELKSSHHSDASLNLRSLDSVYKYHINYFLMPLRLNPM